MCSTSRGTQHIVRDHAKAIESVLSILMCCVMTKKPMHMNTHVAPASSSLRLDDATIGMDIPPMKLYDIASPPYKAIADLLHGTL